MNVSYLLLSPSNLDLYRSLMQLFGEVFDDQESHSRKLPSDEYVTTFLANTQHYVLVATDSNGQVVGGLVAYELPKFEQARTEIYIYDLAVSNAHQRQGIGTGLIKYLKSLAQERGVHTIFVQADKIDKEAIAFYRSLSNQEIDGIVFDIIPGNHENN